MIRYLTIFLLTAVHCAEPQIIAQWNFSNPVFAGSVRGNTGILQENGAVFLQMPQVSGDKPGGYMIGKIDPRLTPPNAFRLEIKFQLSADTAKKQIMLWDNKYILAPKPDTEDKRSHCGFALRLVRQDSQWIPYGHFGYGKSSLAVAGAPLNLDPTRVHTLRVNYTPEQVVFQLDDNPICTKNISAPGPLEPSVYRTVIGDRVGSSYCGLEGRIFEVTLSSLPVESLSINHAGRRGFIRLEPSPKLPVLVANRGGQPMPKQLLTARVLELPDMILFQEKVDVLPGNNVFEIPLDSRLKPGQYQLEITLREQTQNIPFFMAPEQGDIYPVVMWGVGDSGKLAEVGFTHSIIPLTMRKPDPANLNSTRAGMKSIDDALSSGIYTVDNNSFYRTIQSRYQRLDRDGKPYPRSNLDAANPEVVQILTDHAEQAARVYSSHPAYAAALIQSEVRDGSNPSFTGFEEKAFKAYAGYDVPPQVKSRWAPGYSTLPDFPPTRILPDDYPLLHYYRWWWTVGDGWNNLHGAISQAYHRHIGRPFWTFYDPAVRVPPAWGSGGGVDCISQWSYTNADPIKVGQSADEMLAMGAGNPKQMVMKMTQAFWYRNQAAPADKKVANPPEWLKQEPEAKYFSISPDHLRIAFWSMISRKLDGIMYHGYSSLIEGSTHAYRFTCPELKNSLKELTDDVIKPLGPVLKRIPERRPEVAILQSFASTIFAVRHASFGWGKGWGADLHLALQWAHYQPAIIYEEHIRNGILDQVDVLVLPGIEVLPESVFRAIREFQLRGGLVVGDNHLLPGILPDIGIQTINRVTNDPAGTKAKLQKLGASIRKQLEPHYQSPVRADNQDIIVRLRTWKNADYLFVINDKRTFGNYVGQWGIIQEQGLPNQGKIILNRQAGAIYDLVTGQPVKFTAKGGQCEIPVNLAPGAGKILLILDQTLTKQELTVPALATRGKTFSVTIDCRTDALIPLAVNLIDPQGQTAAGSGYFCAIDGKITINLTPSLNDQPGTWQVNVKNLANSQSATATIKVDEKPTSAL